MTYIDDDILFDRDPPEPPFMPTLYLDYEVDRWQTNSGSLWIADIFNPFEGRTLLSTIAITRADLAKELHRHLGKEV